MITLSITRLIETVYALTALHYATHTADEKPPVLTRAHAPALKRLAEKVTAETILSLGSIISTIHTEADSDYITLTLTDSTIPADRLETMRRVLEGHVAEAVLATAQGRQAPALVLPIPLPPLTLVPHPF